jgi:hypothetical protein
MRCCKPYIRSSCRFNALKDTPPCIVAQGHQHRSQPVVTDVQPMDSLRRAASGTAAWPRSRLDSADGQFLGHAEILPQCSKSFQTLANRQIIRFELYRDNVRLLLPLARDQLFLTLLGALCRHG